MIRLLLLLSGWLMISAAASSEAPAPGGEEAYTIVGSWNFRSFTNDACDFGGVMHLQAPDATGAYPCELTARQVCPVNDVEWVVRQSCIANRTDNRLVIRSTIEEFVVGEPTPSYWPDNFILKIRPGDLMTGSLISHGTHASEFTRQVEGIS